MELKEIAKDLLSHRGNVKGTAVISNMEYVRYREGQEGVDKVKKRMAELGFPLELEKIKSSSWQSISFTSLVVLVIREVFDWTEEDIFEMGRFAVKVSFVTKVFVNFLVSKEKLFQEAPRYWKKYFDFGSLESKEFDGNRAIIQIRGHDVHPLICVLRRGYIYGIVSFIAKGQNIKVEETKCTHRGDDCHEYEIILS